MNPHKKELIHTFLHTFLPALTHAHQYTISHQLTVSSIGTAYNHLLEAMGDDQALPLLFIDDKVVVNREPLEDTVYSNRFIHFFRNRGIDHLSINRGITLEEMTSFIERLSASPTPSTTDDMSFSHIRFGKVGLGYKSGEEADDDDPEMVEGEPDETDEKVWVIPEEQETARIAHRFATIHGQELNLMVDVYDAVKTRRSLPDRDIKRVVTDIITAIKEGSSVLLTFSALRVLDEYTFTHSTNVCILTLAQAMALKIKDEWLQPIGVAAMLHDIGKIFVPEEVLNKQGKLTDTEWEFIKKHPQKGAEYLTNKPGIPPLAMVVAYEHHMLYDFSGYPGAFNGWQQNICSQMTTVSDYFDALRSKRIYRDSVETGIITEQMTKMSGKTLNPFLTKNFLLLLKNLSQGAGDIMGTLVKH
jgi:HD-GYP domain-containing protein (c-di-GMP phosphodiesterase class II)